MKRRRGWIRLLLIWPAALALRGQGALEVVPGATQSVFGGGNRPIKIVLKNSSDAPETREVRIRLYQSTTATAVPIGDYPWKQLRVLPRQTVLESAGITFPAVKAATGFLVQWIDSKGRVLGCTRIEAYPPTLLQDLSPGGDDGSLGVSDPTNRIKDALNAEDIPFVDLGTISPGDFDGRLAFVTAQDDDLNLVRSLAEAGVAVVWIRAVPCSIETAVPSFYLVVGKKAAVVVARPEVIADPLHRPTSRLRLAYFARLALNPEPFGLSTP